MMLFFLRNRDNIIQVAQLRLNEETQLTELLFKVGQLTSI